MSDYIVRGMAANGQIRAFAALTKDTVETARQAHDTSPVATAALGRLLTAGGMMGAMMKGEQDVLTLQIKAGGPLQGITVTADSQGNVKGYVGNPQVILPANEKGKLDVASAVGPGFLNVIKDIAEDLTYYFATSEQVPSSVGLGVLMGRENTVRQAGGFIVQLMPFAEEAVISQLEDNLKGITSVTGLLDEGNTPEQLLERLLGNLNLELSDTLPVRFCCNCSKTRVEKALISIGRQELKSMIQEGKPVELNCHFCNTNYQFSIEELKDILHRCR